MASGYGFSVSRGDPVLTTMASEAGGAELQLQQNRNIHDGIDCMAHVNIWAGVVKAIVRYGHSHCPDFSSARHETSCHRPLPCPIGTAMEH